MESINLIPDRPISFNRDFVSLGVGITGALMLSQAVYWSKRTKDEEGWFYKTQEEWEEETGMSRKEQETARKRLKDAGLLEETRAGLPARMYYRINADKLLEALGNSQGCTGSENKNAQIGQTGLNKSDKHSITETTTETTHTARVKKKNVDNFDLNWVKRVQDGEEDVSDLEESYEVEDDRIREIADELVNYVESTGKAYKNHKATLRNWIRRKKRGDSAHKKNPPRQFNGSDRDGYGRDEWKCRSGYVHPKNEECGHRIPSVLTSQPFRTV
jgi:hypothetical protein